VKSGGLKRLRDVSILKTLLVDYVLRRKLLLISCFLIIFVSSLIELIGPLIIRYIIDYWTGKIEELGIIASAVTFIMNLLFLGQKDYTATLYSIAILYLIFVFLSYLSAFLKNWLISAFGNSIVYDLRNDLSKHILRLPEAYYESVQPGRVISIIMNDTELLQSFITSNTLSIFSNMITAVGALAVMYMINPFLCAIAIFITPLLTIISVVLGRFVRKAKRSTREALSRISNEVFETIIGLPVIQSFAKEEIMKGRFNATNKWLREAEVNAEVASRLYSPTIRLILAVFTALLWFVGAGSILEGYMTLGELVAFYQYTNKFFDPAIQIGNIFNEIQTTLAGAERALGLLTENEDENFSLKQGKETKDCRIEFENVWFSYDGKRPVIKDVSFTINPGEKVAIVGSSGAGKTTLINLLLGFYKPDRGTIKIDGSNIEEIDVRSLRNNMVVVFQEPFLLKGTIADNISLEENKDAVMKNAINVAETLGLHEAIKRLPNGYDTMISESFSPFSKGEKQFLCVIRALAKKPKILILDEVTANMDSETQKKLVELVMEKNEELTVIMITHRLEAIHRADKIIVLENGEVKGIGKHVELLGNCPSYKKFCQIYLQIV